MAVGQAAFSPVLDTGALAAAEARMEQREQARHGLRAGQLRDALVIREHYAAHGLALSVVPQIALVLQCAESVADELLHHAQVLVVLPGALEAMDDGLLTVEQSRVLVELTDPVSDDLRLAVWDRLLARLVAAREAFEVLPPARVRQLLARWLIELDPAGAVERRRQAQRGRADVDYRRGDDGLADVYATGLNAAEARAVLSRIAEDARPFGTADPRTAGERRKDAFVDRILGRTGLPFGEAPERRGCGERGSCGCPLGAPVPCGAHVQVLVPLSAALGVSGTPAEVLGSGPLDAELLARLLAASPRLQAVWAGDDGVPVAVDAATVTPDREDPDGLLRALLRLIARAPSRTEPRHPDDHDPPPGDDPADDGAPRDDGAPPDHGGAGPSRDGDPPFPPGARPRPRLLTRAHPVGTPGPYCLPARLRRLVTVRAPRCEWPGCGARAVRCDLDHDLAHPYGATCGCNVGPLCRRHHRVKQQGWVKHRTRDGGVRWTSPVGRTWTSPPQHQPPPPAAGLPHPVTGDRRDDLLPWQWEDELHGLDPASVISDQSDPVEPDPADDLREHLESRDSRWTVDLADPWAWSDVVQG